MVTDMKACFMKASDSKGKMTLASGVEEEGVWYDDKKIARPVDSGCR